MISISFVIPVFKNSNILRILHKRLCNVCDANSYDFEIIFIDDARDSESWNVILDLSEKFKNVHGVQFRSNYGQHNALLCGIRRASMELCVTLDDDLQHPPEEVPELVREIHRGYDLVYGIPKKERHGFFRDLSSKVTKYAISSACGRRFVKDVSAFRIFKTDLKNGFSRVSSAHVNVDVLLSWCTSQITSVKVSHEERLSGSSGYSIIKLYHHAINMLTGYSTTPIHLTSAVGIFFALTGFFLLFYIIIIWLFCGSTVPGFLFLSAMITLFSGVQLLSLGVFGEYIARIYSSTMEKPQYVEIASTFDLDKKNKL